MISSSRSGGAVLRILAVAALVLAGWLAWRGAEPLAASTAQPGRVVLNLAPQASVLRVRQLKERARPPTLAWLVGTWSTRDNKGVRDAPCDLPSAITFLANGQYFSPKETGRFAVSASGMIYWGRITYDVDGGEDLSNFEERSTGRFTWVGDDVAYSDSVFLYRCEKSSS
jgi:hypothetical protein